MMPAVQARRGPPARSADFPGRTRVSTLQGWFLSDPARIRRDPRAGLTRSRSGLDIAPMRPTDFLAELDAEIASALDRVGAATKAAPPESAAEPSVPKLLANALKKELEA